MKYLRQYIRQILLEDAFDFAKEAGMLQRAGELDMPDDVGNATSKSSRRKVKDLFRLHADHEWLKNNITTVHWSRDAENLEVLVGKGKDEISTSMSKTGQPVIWHDYGPIGLWVQGHISIAANNMNDIVSGHYREYTPEFDFSVDQTTPEEFEQQKASSGINKQPKSLDRFIQYASAKDDAKTRRIFNDKYRDNFPYILDADTWKTPGRFPNEALVDNWQAKGIILADDDKLEWLADTGTFFYRGMTSLAKQFGVPIYDKSFNLLWEE